MFIQNRAYYIHYEREIIMSDEVEFLEENEEKKKSS